MYQTINPATAQWVGDFPTWDDARIESVMQRVQAAWVGWSAEAPAQRATVLTEAAQILEQKKPHLATLISLEMGKLIAEARAEIDKCAWVCRYYAQHGVAFLSDDSIATDAGRSYVHYQPLGAVLAVMPWNFPIWQVFRFAAPALMAGNVGILKHASNVPQCALAIEDVFRDAGCPQGVFTTMLIDSRQVAQLIGHPAVAAVTLTGSENAGRQVAATAAQHLKKSVLELGGSDAFIVLEDADLDAAVHGALLSRFMNCGQSCIAAKRFIVVDEVADAFVEAFHGAVQTLTPGDPLDASTRLAPMARADLRDQVHDQVSEALHHGAHAVTGCQPLQRKGFYYAPSILDGVNESMRVYHEEVFGPVALIVRARDAQQALALANSSRFGLSGSVWSTDISKAENIAVQLQSGAAFVNGIVKSDPRLPFGGIKASGYGRELSLLGIREFINAKSIWIK